MSTQHTARLTIVDHRGALERGEQPTTRTLQVEGLPTQLVGELAAVVLGLPPAWPAPAPGTHTVAKAGGSVTVTIANDT